MHQDLVCKDQKKKISRSIVSNELSPQESNTSIRTPIKGVFDAFFKLKVQVIEKKRIKTKKIQPRPDFKLIYMIDYYSKVV